MFVLVFLCYVVSILAWGVIAWSIWGKGKPK